MIKSKSEQKKELAYTQREIAESLNNSVARTMHPVSMKGISSERLGSLRDYAHAAIKVLMDHVDEGLLEAEELVAILTSAAFVIHLRYIMKTSRFPYAEDAEFLLTPKTTVKEEELECNS
jgi:hypothetical protein